MTGHLFVLRGDLGTLACDAVLVPADSRGNVVRSHWSGLLPPSVEQGDLPGWARVDLGGRSWVDLPDVAGRRVRAVATAGGRNEAAHVAATAAAAVADLAPDLAPRQGRARPLVALPLIGTGQGGFARTRGSLIRSLLPALRGAAEDVDIALVLRHDRDHQAVQSSRTDADWDLPEELLTAADELGAAAGRRELALFLGAGVSVPLGAPSWNGLLETVAERGGVELPTATDPVARATELEELLGPGAVQDGVVAALAPTAGRCAPAHVLLAALDVERSVTTNYDTAYETAVRASRPDRPFRVLARELPGPPDPWLLKLHGDVAQPETIVLTQRGYDRLHESHRALVGVVEALLHTGRVLFVGYSLSDRSFLEPAERVVLVRRLADPDLTQHFASVVALDPSHVVPHAGVQVLSMDGGDPARSARQLEVFLDRMAWRATVVRGADGFLLDDHYADLRSPDDEVVVEALRDLLAREPAGSVAWPRLRELRRALGD